MGKVYYISKNVGLGLLVLVISALITIIALSIAYDKERAKNQGQSGHAASDGSSTSPPFTTSFTPKEPWDYYRLPKSLIPQSYSVTLWPRLQPNADGMYIFTGYSTVIFRCVRETDLIIIHSNKLNFTTVFGNPFMLYSLSKILPPPIYRTWLVERTEYLVIQLFWKLTMGASYVLHSNFTGELADDLQGFYRSEYTDNGVKK